MQGSHWDVRPGLLNLSGTLMILMYVFHGTIQLDSQVQTM